MQWMNELWAGRDTIYRVRYAGDGRDTCPWIRVSNVWTMTHVGCRWNVLAVFVNLCASYVIPRNSLRCCPFASSLHWLSDGRAKTMATFFLRESDIYGHISPRVAYRNLATRRRTGWKPDEGGPIHFPLSPVTRFVLYKENWMYFLFKLH